MPNYQGETFEITNAATDFDGTVLTPSMVTSVAVEIVDSAATPNVVLTTTAMTWDSARALWFYLWDTSQNDIRVGNYQARVTVTGLDNTKSFNYLKLRLAAPRF